MKIQTNAVNILERTSAYLKAGVITEAPAWYDVVASIPPKTKFCRVPKFKNPANGKDRRQSIEIPIGVGHNGIFKTRANTSDKKVSSNVLFKPPKLSYIEDEIRKLFYEQHPWERSRPKILVENSMDNDYNWSHISQLGKPLDGENVVQRSLYLLKTKEQDTLTNAYNQARFEFYRIRMQQEIQEQVAQEEAEMFGSVFGQTAIEFGIGKEQSVIETWKRKALKETELLSARRANPSESWGSDGNEKTSDTTKQGSIEEEEIEELYL